MKTISIAAAAIALLATPAMASQTIGAREPVSIRVSTAGLNLATARDQERLRLRLKRAIAEACSPQDRLSLDTSPDLQCHQEMSANAAPALRNMAQNSPSTTVGQN